MDWKKYIDAIDFLRIEYSIPKDKMLVDEIGTRIPLDIVIRLMDKFKKSSLLRKKLDK